MLPMIRLLVAAVLMALTLNSALARDDVVRFGLTAVVIRENLRFFDHLANYLESRINRPIEFVRTRTYREIMEKLRDGELDFAWICGYPYVVKRDPEYLKLMVVPVYNGFPMYRSYIIVPHDSPYREFNDLKGKVFAFSDPDSNSGYLYPRHLLFQQGQTPESFFRQTIFTYNHAETVEAVAAKVADGGAVDSYVWEQLNRTQPKLAEKTKVIGRSGLFGFPPVVAQVKVDADLYRLMEQALLEMNKVEKGRSLLNDLGLDGFDAASPSLFDGIRLIAERMNRHPAAIGAGTDKTGGGE